MRRGEKASMISSLALGRFQSDGAPSMAVKGLKEKMPCACVPCDD